MNHTRHYRQEGYVVLREALPFSQVTLVREALEIRAKHDEPTRTVLFTHEQPAETRPMTDLMFQHRNVLREGEPALRQTLRDMMVLAERVIRYEPLPFQDVSLVKQPGAPEFPWHQDLPYWPVDRDDGCVAWLALTSSNDQNGALQVAPRSHLEDIGPAVDLHTGEAQQGSTASPVVPTTSQTVPLTPGDIVLFHCRTLHRSGPNNTSHDRHGLAVSFVHPGTCWSHERAPRHPLCTSTSHGEELRPWSTANYRLPPA